VTDRLSPSVDSSALASGRALTVRSVARGLGVPSAFVMQLIGRGDLTAVAIGGRLVVPIGALRAFGSGHLGRRTIWRDGPDRKGDRDA
jgi:hypothetical protein